MEKQSLPNITPANIDNPAGVMQDVLANFAKSFESCMPAIVESYDRSTHIATVKPAVSLVLTTGEQVERASLLCSVWRFMCGGFLVDLPIAEGDTGWIIAADRDTSTFKQTSAVSKPNTKETHKYSAGFFIPDSFGTFAISPEDDGRMVLQNLLGTEKVSIGESDTKITSASLTITSPSITITGDLSLTGNLSINGIGFSTHVHSGGTLPGSLTGVAQ